MNYEINSRIWIKADDNMLLGIGRVELLKAIDKTGSLSKAAVSMKMSYKKAWELIDSVNKSGALPAVRTSTGGKDGGGTVLTEYGKEIISIYEKIDQKCKLFLEEELKKIDFKCH
ncbi:LysR family transcriptional regulator [Flavobacteriaceae bacterium R38]|nr:LysR family transcriptional regulator [Flavobacteriaceae bacterium R38]